MIVTACDEDNPSPQPSESSDTSSATPTSDPTSVAEVGVTTLPRALTGPPRRMYGIPTTMPEEIAALPDVPFDGSEHRYTMAYRPYEGWNDAYGWEGEESALMTADGTWYRLPFERLGLDPALWRGEDMLGPGRLNSAGDKLLLQASRGAIVIDLRSGEHEQIFTKRGTVGYVLWRPDTDVVIGSGLTGRRPPRRAFQIDLKTGVETTLPAASYSLGFRAGDQTCSATSPRRNDEARLKCWDPGGDLVTESIYPIPGPRPNPETFRNWASSSFTALERASHGIYAYNREDDSLSHILKIGPERVSTYFGVHGWIDPDSFLFSMNEALAVWRPASGEIIKIASLPSSDHTRVQGSVGITFPPFADR